MDISNGANSDKSVKPKGGKRSLRWLIRGLVSVGVLALVFILMDWALRRIAIGQLVELTSAKVKAKSVDVGLNGSVFIEKLVIGPHKEQRYDDAILKAETVHARFSIVSLLLLRPRLKEITVKDFIFNAQYDLDTGRWNVAALKIKVPKRGTGKMPLVHLEKGALQYSKVANGKIKAIAGVPIAVRLGPAGEAHGGYKFNMATARRPGYSRSTLTGFWRPGRVTTIGAISSADVAAFERAWMINILAAELDYDQYSNYSLKLRIRDFVTTHRPAGGTLALDSRVFFEKSSVFAALQRFFNRYRPAGRVNIDLDKALGNLSGMSGSVLRGTVHCEGVSICDHKFPYAIEHITGPIEFTENSFELKNLTGYHGDVKVTFNGRSEGFGPSQQYDIQLTSDNMALDNDIYDALNTKQKKFWSAFSPSGVAAIEYRISRDPQTGSERILAVEPLGAEAVYCDFPYPLKNLTGRLLFDDDSTTVQDVVSQVDERKITINGRVTAHDTDRPIYDISVRARNIPLDPTLAASLSDRQRHFYDELNMAGLADADVEVLTSKDDPRPTNVTASVLLKQASLKLDDFPLAVSDVSAKTVITHDLIGIENFTGRYGQNPVSLTGRIWPGNEAEQFHYRLSLRTEQAQLNDDLFGLLPQSLRRTVSELHPEGKINCTVDLNKAAATDRLDYKITVDCLGNSFTFEPFPYPLKNITGTLTMAANSVSPRSITTGANVPTTPESMSARIVGRLAQAEDGLSDSHFDLDLENIKLIDAGAGETHIGFAGVAKFKNCNLNTSPPITELDAVLKIEGLYKTGEGFDNGWATLSADSLRIKGKSVTGLKANLDYSPHRKSWLTNNLIADSYGGRVAGKFELKQSGERDLEYLLQVGFENIDLKQFLSHAKAVADPEEKVPDGAKPKQAPHKNDTSGKVNGSLSLLGQISEVHRSNTGRSEVGGDVHSSIGRCKLTISDMQVGKLSLLAKLLYVLQLTEPRDFAFDRMVADSYIKHNKLFFEYLDFSGDAVAFNGSGWIDLQNQNVDLVLFARGSRLAVTKPSVFQSLTDTLCCGVVRMEVTGKLDDPKITTTTLPVINETLKIFGAKATSPNP